MNSTECVGTAGYSVQIWDTVDAIDVPAWESLRVADDPFMDLRMLRVTAGTMPATDSFRFLLVRDGDGRPVAATCLWTLSIVGTMLSQDDWLIRAIKRVAALIPTLNHHRILVCGMPISAGQSNLRFAPGADQASILKVLNEKLDEICRSERLRCVVFKEFESPDPKFASALESLGYRRANSLPMNECAPDYNSFEGYLKTLNSKKRSQIRNTYKKLQGGDVRLVVTSDPQEVAALYTDRVHGLYHEILENTEVQLETLTAGFFRELSREFPDETSYCFILKGDVVLAFGVVLFAGRVAYPLYLGVDYDQNAEHELYFNTMYAMFDQSLQRGAELVSWGQTADEFKRLKLNCYQTPRCIFLKGTTWVMRTVIGLLFSELFPERVVASLPDRKMAAKRAA